MTIEERIYERLRNASRGKSYNFKSVEPTRREIRRSRIRGEFQERLTDFTTEEVMTLLLEENIANQYLGFIGQGKEANIYWIVDCKNRLTAVKMFRIHTTSHNLSTVESDLDDNIQTCTSSQLTSCFIEVATIICN